MLTWITLWDAEVAFRAGAYKVIVNPESSVTGFSGSKGDFIPSLSSSGGNGNGRLSKGFYGWLYSAGLPLSF